MTLTMLMSPTITEFLTAFFLFFCHSFVDFSYTSISFTTIILRCFNCYYY